MAARKKSDIEHYLAEVLIAFLVAESLDQRIQIEMTIHHRPHIVGVNRPHHILLLLADTDQYALQTQLIGQRWDYRQVACNAAENTNNSNMTTHPGCGHGLFQRGRATHIEDAVNATAASQITRGFAPIDVLAVIDQMIGSQLPQ